MSKHLRPQQRPTVKQVRTSSMKAGAMALASVLLVGTLGIGGVAAYLHAAAEAVPNSFLAASTPTITVVEDFDGTVKSNVGVQVTGDAAVLVRAAVVATFTDDAGNLLSQVPVEDVDYTITYGSGWTHGADGFWYCNSPITNGTTANLIEKAQALPGFRTAEMHLTIDILAQVVQAAPASAVSQAWGMSYSNGTWTAA